MKKQNIEPKIYLYRNWDLILIIQKLIFSKIWCKIRYLFLNLTKSVLPITCDIVFRQRKSIAKEWSPQTANSTFLSNKEYSIYVSPFHNHPIHFNTHSRCKKSYKMQEIRIFSFLNEITCWFFPPFIYFQNMVFIYAL